MKRLIDFIRSKFSKKEKENNEVSKSVKDMEGLPSYKPEEIFGTADKKIKMEDFSTAVNYLAIRLYPEQYPEQYKPEDLIYRKNLDGTVSLLVYDLPDSVEVVLRQQTEKWDKDLDTLFQIGLDNTRGRYPRDIEEIEHHIKKVTGEDVFVTSDALYLDKHKSLIGKFGSVFCIPHRDLLAAYPINNDIDLEYAMQTMIPYAEEQFERAGEHAITNKLYWFFEGKSELIYTYYGLNRLKYVLPPDLEELIY